MAANTPANYYLDTQRLKGVCEKESLRIKNNCATSNKTKNSLADKLMGKKASAKLDDMKKKLGDKAPQWLLQHCDGLWMKPVSPKVSGEIQELADGLKEMNPEDILTEATKRIDSAKEVLE